MLNQKGEVVTVQPTNSLKVRGPKRAVALDSEANPMQVKDQVRVIDGPCTGRQGEIKHLHHGTAFVYSRMVLENGGIFVCKTRHLLLQTPAKDNRTMGTGAAAAATAEALSSGFMSPRVAASPAHPSSGSTSNGRGGGGGGSNNRGGRGGGGGQRGGFGGARGGRDRADLELIGKTIKITQGHYKGYIGIVKVSTKSLMVLY